MSKRFTDTEKWKKNWFLSLKPTHKCFWFYLCDNCTNAGIWDVNFKLASFMIGENLEERETREIFKKQFIEIDGGKRWHIPDFCFFQYGVLRDDCKPHAKVISELARFGLFKGITYPLEEIEEVPGRVQEQEKDKDKEVLEDRKKPFGEMGLVLLTPEEHEKLLVKLGERRTADYVQRLENYIGSKGKKYKSHYHTILSWAANPKSGESDALNLNPKQQKNMEALSDFTRRRAAGPEDLRSGNGNSGKRLPGS